MLLSQSVTWGLFYKNCELISSFFFNRPIRSFVCDSVFAFVGRLPDSLEGETREHMIPRGWGVSPRYLADSGP